MPCRKRGKLSGATHFKEETMSAIISGKIKSWEKQPSGGINCEFELKKGEEHPKITFWTAEKGNLMEKYPKGSIVEIVHDKGTGKVMRPFGEQPETTPAAQPTSAPAKVKGDEPVKKTGVVKSDMPTKEETAQRAAEAGFKTAAEENEVVKAADAKKRAIAEAATVKAREQEQATQRMKDNEEHARQLATDRSAAQAVTSRIPPLTQTPTQTSSSAVSTKVQEPVGHGVDPAATAQQTAIMAYKGNVLTPYGQMPVETWDLVQKGMIPVDETTLQIEVEFSLQIDRFRPLRVKMSGQGRERVTKMFAEQFQTMLDIVIPISQRFPRFD